MTPRHVRPVALTTGAPAVSVRPSRALRAAGHDLALHFAAARLPGTSRPHADRK